MNPTDYEYLSNFLLGTSGLALGEGKEYLLEARLVPLAQSWDLENMDELIRALRKGTDKRLSSAVTDAMTTNETSFFRDKNPFEELKQRLLPSLVEARQTSRRLRIWCCACSTGQEPYSLAMLLEESFPHLRDWTIEIVCTDISQSILDRAQEGIYSQFEVQRGLPVQMLMKYFEQCETGWQIKAELRRRIQWHTTNLLDDFSRFGMFDLVFCRNVLIYFQVETKKDILNRVRKVIRNDGYLFLGAAETVLGICDAFERFKECKSAVYAPKAAVTV